MFDLPNKPYPKTWKEMSLDFRLMFIYHVCMMILFVIGQKLTLREEILIAATVAVVLISISRRHRRATRWHWPGIRRRDGLFAIGAAIGIAFFLHAASPLFPPSDHRFLPWYLAGLGIGTFGILSSLRIAYSSEAEFLTHCRTIDQYGREADRASELPEVKNVEPDWKKVARGIYTVTFVLVWIAGVASFLTFGNSFKNGTSTPTATQTEPLTDHGKTVYVTRPEKQRMDQFQMANWFGVPFILVVGVTLHFLVGVKLVPNVPTLREYWDKKAHSEASTVALGDSRRYVLGCCGRMTVNPDVTLKCL